MKSKNRIKLIEHKKNNKRNSKWGFSRFLDSNFVEKTIGNKTK